MATQTEKFLNVTELPPQEKHPTIFQYFNDLKEGEGFVIQNDHDPKPLYYQLLSTQGDIFTWEYLKQGPEVFEIRIAKKELSDKKEEKASAQKGEKVLNVPELPPAIKHPTIFQWFDDLKEGESFIIHNDHDPKPLYYQLMGTRGDIFDWEYLQQGSTVFEIRITKKILTPQEEPLETVGSVAAEDYRKAEVFKDLGIDFCCNGEKSLKEAAEEAAMTEEDLRKALSESDKVSAATTPSQDYNKWELDFLSDYIKNTHHRYVKENAEVLVGMSQKIAEHHGANHPELKELASRVKNMIEDFMNHMSKEETVLFPAIKKLVEMKNNNSKLAVEAGGIGSAIEKMEAEHDETGDDLKYFRKLTNDYAIPSDACNSYQFLFEKLQEFEEDTFRHVHLENNILFPKAVKLEEQLVA